MENETIMIHTTTGAILSVDYWLFREVIHAALRDLQTNDENHLALCRKITDHLIKTR